MNENFDTKEGSAYILPFCRSVGIMGVTLSQFCVVFEKNNLKVFR